ncbi:MAG: endonuclease domain-containing protein [Pacificimonas sp.]
MAKTLRGQMSEPELLLWQHLRGSPAGLRFRRQHPAGPYVLDFYCAKAKLCIEVDGEQHGTETAREHDAKRDAYLRMQGINVVRYSTAEVWRDASGVAETIVYLAIDRADGLASLKESVL